MNNILFWSRYDPQIDVDFITWRNRTIDIAPLHHLALESHSIIGNTVYLYSYQTINNSSFPPGIILKDANDIYPAYKIFNAIRRGHSLAHISDLIRLSVASEIGGAVLDMDTVILKKLPDRELFVATVPAKLSGGVAPKWGDNFPPCVVNDRSWDGKALANFPIMVDKSVAEYIARICRQIEISLIGPLSHNSKAWNFVMWSIKKLPIVNKDYKVYPPIYFGPLPAWMPKDNCYSLEYPTRLDGRTILFGYTLPSIDNIFDTSYCVQHFFESAFKTTRIYKNLWKDLRSGSLLAREAEFILGNNWREILIEKMGHTS